MMSVSLSGVVLILMSIGLNIQTAESCRCFPVHPQQKFCTSELVILADVTSKGNVFKGNLFRYNIKTIQVLKGVKTAKEIQYVYTDQSSCGVVLEQSQYVLSGNTFKDGINVGLCNLINRWNSLSLSEQGNLQKSYKNGCNCTISTCNNTPCCPQSNKECMWETSSSKPLESACLEDRDGTCSWYRTVKDPKDPQCKP